MKKKIYAFITSLFILANISGCIPLVIGGAAGALGAYAASRDTIEGETDKSYGALWGSAVMIARAQGNVKIEDQAKGFIDLLSSDASKVQIRLVRLTRFATRIKISARRHHLPNLTLAQDMFVRIVNGAR